MSGMNTGCSEPCCVLLPVVPPHPDIPICSPFTPIFTFPLQFSGSPPSLKEPVLVEILKRCLQIVTEFAVSVEGFKILSYVQFFAVHCKILHC